MNGFSLRSDQEDRLEIATISDSASLSAEQARLFHAYTGASVIPVLGDHSEYEQVLTKGSREVVLASLLSLDVVDEQLLSMTQVLEFRQDYEASRKYRRLLSWLDKELAKMSEQDALEAIERKLDDYTWALKKHGIKTTVGAVSEILEAKYLVGATAVAAAATAAGFPILGLLAAAGIAIGKVGVRIATDHLELEDRAKGEHSEVAWLYETKRRLF